MRRVRLRKLWLIAALLVLGVAAAGAQRAGNFRILGPGGGGAMYHPAISPHDPQTALVSCDMSGGYITHDGGRTWRMFNLRGGMTGFEFDPVDPKVIYAVGIGLWRSGDGGDTWALLAPRPAEVRGVLNPSDDAEITILAKNDASDHEGGFTPPSAFAIDPLDRKRLYLAIAYRLWTSKDGGEHWIDNDNLPSMVSELAVFHKNGKGGTPNVVMASHAGFSFGTGSNPLPIAPPAGAARLDAEAMDVIDGRVLALAVANGRLYQGWVDASGKNAKLEWTASGSIGEGTKITTIASGHDGKTVYASFSQLKLDGNEWVGIAKSEDLGGHWTIAWKDAGRGAPNLSDGWLSRSFESNWGEEPLGLAVSQKEHGLVYATDLGRTLKSTDGGAHWTAAYTQDGADGGAASNGLDVLTSFGVFFDPFEAKRMFVGYADVGLMRSENRGESWHSSFAGAPGPWRANTYSMVFDPANRGRAWAAMTGTHDLPRARMWRDGSVTEFRGGICVSDDAGAHWTVASDGLPPVAPTSLVLDPKSPVLKRTLYVATMGHGIYKSVDGGKKWVAKNQGLSQREPLAWRLTPAADGALYVVIARRSEDGSIGNAGDGALYRSRDGAETWEKVALPAGVNGPNALAIDPREPARMYLAAWGRNTGQHGAGGGIFGTADGGAHWTLLFGGDQHVSDVALNPENPSELYAVGFDSSAWHSTDRGAHWERIAGYNFKAGTRITPDPAHPGMVFINTFGGGVWYGRVDGKPGVEDIASKEIAP